MPKLSKRQIAPKPQDLCVMLALGERVHTVVQRLNLPARAV